MVSLLLSLGYTLSLKAGVGWISFMPTLEKLCPEAIYNDKVSFYYNDSNESGNTLGILGPCPEWNEI